MRRILCVLAMASIICSGVFASVEGRTNIGVNYGYDGDNLFGLTVDNIGYVNEGAVGYYIGLDTGFDIKNIENWRVGMIVGPSYSYDFDDAAMSVEIAAGASADYKTTGTFSFGLGGYLGAAWHFAKNMDIILGAKLGSNFVGVALDSNSWSVEGDFYVVPSLSIGFKY